MRFMYKKVRNCLFLVARIEHQQQVITEKIKISKGGDEYVKKDKIKNLKWWSPRRELLKVSVVGVYRLTNSILLFKSIDN